MRSRSLTIWVTGLVLCMASSQVKGTVEFKDGLIHDISNEINDDVWVDWESPNPPHSYCSACPVALPRPALCYGAWLHCL